MKSVTVLKADPQTVPEMRHDRNRRSISGLHRWTRADYHRMITAGVFDDLRVELLNGRIWDMPPQLTPHAVCVGMTTRAVTKAFGDHAVPRVQLPIALDDRSEPEPDIAMVPGQPEDYIQDHPRPHQILLLIELSDKTLVKDRGRKAKAYSRAGIADYWIVNLVDRCLEVYRSPTSDGRYLDTQTFGPNDSVQPLALQDIKILVASLLPPIPQSN